MIEEKDIRTIYDEFYKIAKVVGNREYTLDFGVNLGKLLTDRIQVVLEDTELRGDTRLKELEDLVGIIKKIDKEYTLKFKELIADRQGGRL